MTEEKQQEQETKIKSDIKLETKTGELVVKSD